MSNNNDKTFAGIIGQQKVVNKLKFYLEGYRNTGILPVLLLDGPAGSGKTRLGHDLAAGTNKAWLEVNGGSVKNMRAFGESVLPRLADRDVLLFMDEAHALPTDIETFLLTVVNPTKENKNKVRYDGVDYEIDMARQSFVFATTETHAIFKPLRDRLTVVSLDDYTPADLGKILCLNAPQEVTIGAEALEKMVGYTRKTARSAVLLGREIANYYNVTKKKKIDVTDVDKLAELLVLYPMGLTEGELLTLRELDRAGANGLSLTDLAARRGHTPQAQRNQELHLMSNSLMLVDRKRKITALGKDYLKRLDKEKTNGTTTGQSK